MNYQAIGILLTFTTLIVSASTAYLRMFNKTMFTDWAEKFETKIANETERIVNLKLENLKQQITFHDRELMRLEGNILRIDEKKQTKLS